MKAKQIIVTLFGKAGTRHVSVTAKGGFPTRHIKARREDTPPPKKARTPKPAKTAKPARVKLTLDPVSIVEVIRFMHASANHSDWLIIDEILFVATAQFKIRANHTTLLPVMRTLFKNGHVEHRKNRFDQDCFRLIETGNLKALLAEVKAIMDKGSAK